ncbi:hypothetical protein GCM10010525_09350 [Glutamicibacter bergerei]|uniref:Uncharacterized protein n=1 Tax=Glutamicibacter ardleyensis TaxID=225894 RepID=A0ABQ2DKP1_9MICC|nr:hypothetical protein GCM10007173_20090 [Glutamicibacter ardleyensis]
MDPKRGSRGKRFTACFGEQSDTVSARTEIRDQMRGMRFHPAGKRCADWMVQMRKNRNAKWVRRVQ